MGFHPESGEELQPITIDIVEQFKNQRDERKRELERRRRRPPQQVDPEKYPFFDAVSGEPQVWYWRSQSGEYEFFDNKGFHPNTGEPLNVINQAIIAAWKQEIAERETRLKQELARKEREARERAERIEREQQQALAKQQQEAQAGIQCDQAAANPTDSRKPSDLPGVRYEDLKEGAAQAVEICRFAVEKFPQELRYKYQLARAIEINEPNKAIPIYKQLTNLNYAAAFDNLGSIYLRKQNYASAISVFKAGVRANDPDSMGEFSPS